MLWTIENETEGLYQEILKRYSQPAIYSTSYDLLRGENGENYCTARTLVNEIINFIESEVEKFPQDEKLQIYEGLKYKFIETNEDSDTLFKLENEKYERDKNKTNLSLSNIYRQNKVFTSTLIIYLKEKIEKSEKSEKKQETPVNVLNVNITQNNIQNNLQINNTTEIEVKENEQKPEQQEKCKSGDAENQAKAEKNLIKKGNNDGQKIKRKKPNELVKDELILKLIEFRNLDKNTNISKLLPLLKAFKKDKKINIEYERLRSFINDYIDCLPDNLKNKGPAFILMDISESEYKIFKTNYFKKIGFTN